MSNTFQVPCDRRGTFWSGLLLLVAMIHLSPETAAHDLFRAYVQHCVRLTVGARYIDLVLDLTFFEEWSARERALMDADTNGRITRSELESYIKRLAPQLATQVQLCVGGREFTPVPLYDPEVDLLADDKVGPAHHRLRLFFFLPTPANLGPNSEVVVEDRLWPDAKGLGTLQAEGHDGCTLEAEKPSDPAFNPARPGEARLFRFRCVKPPGAPTTPAHEPRKLERMRLGSLRHSLGGLRYEAVRSRGSLLSFSTCIGTMNLSAAFLWPYFPRIPLRLCVRPLPAPPAINL